MPHDHLPNANNTSSRARWVFLAFLVMGGALLFTEHRAHVLGIVPWLFVLACPLMHVFMHGGHGHGGHQGGAKPPGTRPIDSDSAKGG